MREMHGLVQPTTGGHFQARRRKPADLARRGWRGPSPWLKQSTGTANPEKAIAARAVIYKVWDAEIAAARREAPAALETVALLATAIEAWRRRECAAAALSRSTAALVPHWIMPEAPAPKRFRSPKKSNTYSFTITGTEAAEVGDSDIVEIARAYFTPRGDVSRELGMPWAVSQRIGKLQVAERDPDGWMTVADFDQTFDVAVAAGGYTRPVPVLAREALRQRFAAAWLEVEQHREAARQRAAAILAAVDVAPASLRIPRARDAYEPQEDDVVLGVLIDEYRAARNARFGEAATDRKYQHIFRALEELLGREKPIRAITKEDCRKVRAFLHRLPVHAGKKFPGMSLMDATAAADEVEANAADEDFEVQRLAPNTINSYVSNLIAVLNFAIQQRDGWLEKNPATGLVEENVPLVKRRGFSDDELLTVANALEGFKTETPWKWWTPVLSAYHGLRLNELCQLRTDDLRQEAGVYYLAIEPFNAAGRRVKDKRTKNIHSERNVPLHPDVAADFVAFVQGLPPGRIFAEITPVNGSFSHEPSKWFGLFLDKIGLTDAGLVFHSFRHGFRDRCDAAGVAGEYRRAIGGWAAKDEAEKYGSRAFVPVLYREVSKLSLSLTNGTSVRPLAED